MTQKVERKAIFVTVRAHKILKELAKRERRPMSSQFEVVMEKEMAKLRTNEKENVL